MFRIPLSQHRAEEKGRDAWSDFIIPPKFNSIDFRTSGQTRIIEGGRGSGKTMLLSYLSFASEFAENKNDIPNNAISHVGLHIRPDSTYYGNFKGDDLSEVNWIKYFESNLIVEIFLKFLASLETISKSSFQLFGEEDFDLKVISDFYIQGEDEQLTLRSLKRIFSRSLQGHSDYYSNFLLEEYRPYFITFRRFKEFISSIKSSFKGLNDLNVYLYIDEYENLLNYQKSVINTWIKHSERPLVIHAAMRPNVIGVYNKTLTEETIQETHDYRVITIEEDLRLEQDVFHWEIILAELKKYEPSINIDINNLKSEKHSEKRCTEEYQKKILQEVERFFPNTSVSEYYEIIFNDSAIKNKLFSKIKFWLKERQIELTPKISDMFFNVDYKELSILSVVLLPRATIKNEQLLTAFGNYISKKDSSKVKNWLHNNTIAAILYLYEIYSIKDCPIYSGYSTFEKLADNNIRFLIEICHRAIQFENDFSNEELDLKCNWKAMTQAARVTSEKFLDILPTYGSRGKSLHKVVYRMGELFNKLQRKESQSENEINHFTISGGFPDLEEDGLELIRELEKYKAIKLRLGTKTKDKENSRGVDIKLSPNFSPFFGISYRRKKSVYISQEQCEHLLSGSDKLWKELELKLLKSDVPNNISQMGLFGEL